MRHKFSDELVKLISAKNNPNLAPNNCLVQLAKKHGGVENYIKAIEVNSLNVGRHEGVIIGVVGTLVVAVVVATGTYFVCKTRQRRKAERIAAELAKAEIVRIVEEAEVMYEDVTDQSPPNPTSDL